MTKNLILTNYFTGKPDPQSGEFRPKDDPELLTPWIESVTRLNLDAVIFHDESLSSSFNGNISLEKYELKTDWSVNDERFLCWYEYLTDHPEIGKVFLTDLFDVSFNKNPFDLIVPEYDLYLGVGAGFDRPIIKNRWLCARFQEGFGQVFHGDKRTVNAGVIGGTRDNILNLLYWMVKTFREKQNPNNINMAVFNKCVYDLYLPARLMIGPPVTSLFKKYEKEGNFAIRHK